MAKQTFSVGQVLTAAQMTSLQQTAMLGGSATAKTTSYTLVAADAGTVVSVNSTSATTITVNTGLFAAGDTVTIQNWGSGAVTITAGTATVNTAGSLIVPQYDGGVLYFTSASEAIYFDWVQAGATSPLTTKGDIWGYSTSDARIPVGANDTVLTADSTQALGVKWATPAAGGGLTLISETVASNSSSVSLTSIPGTYKQLMLVWSGIKFVSASEQALGWRFNNDSGANYASMYLRNADTATSTNRGLNTDADVYLLYSTAAASNLQEMGSGSLIIDNYASTTKFKKYWANYGFYTGGANQTYVQNGTYKSTSAITSLDTFRTASNNFSNDTNTSIRLYGIS